MSCRPSGGVLVPSVVRVRVLDSCLTGPRSCPSRRRTVRTEGPSLLIGWVVDGDRHGESVGRLDGKDRTWGGS